MKRSVDRVCALGVLALLSVPWGCSQLPSTPPARAAVLEAAKQVISERYPMSALSERGSFLYATTPVELTANSQTQKQISVIVQRNLTGAYIPIVKVRLYADVGTPSMRGNPDSPNAPFYPDANPLALPAWQVLDYLPYEGQEVYEAILKKLQGKGV